MHPKRASKKPASDVAQPSRLPSKTNQAVQAWIFVFKGVQNPGRYIRAQASGLEHFDGNRDGCATSWTPSRRRRAPGDFAAAFVFVIRAYHGLSDALEDLNTEAQRARRATEKRQNRFPPLCFSVISVPSVFKFLKVYNRFGGVLAQPEVVEPAEPKVVASAVLSGGVVASAVPSGGVGRGRQFSVAERCSCAGDSARYNSSTHFFHALNHVIERYCAKIFCAGCPLR